MSALERELARRAADGRHPTTIRAMSAHLATLGYRLDRRMDCRGSSQIIAGLGAGDSYPCVTTGINEADTGRRFCNVNARRDERFARLQELRRSETLFAVTRGAVLEL